MPEPQGRDMDLVRQILLDIESGELLGPVLTAAFAKDPRLPHHLEIMADADEGIPLIEKARQEYATIPGVKG